MSALHSTSLRKGGGVTHVVPLDRLVGLHLLEESLHGELELVLPPGNDPSGVDVLEGEADLVL